jgi:hypothetical protein
VTSPQIVVECPRCRRPLCALVAARYGGARFVSMPDSSSTGRLYSADTAYPGRTTNGPSRVTIRCVSRYHHQPVVRSVTPSAGNDTYRRAVTAGLTRVSLFDLRADAVQR